MSVVTEPPGKRSRAPKADHNCYEVYTLGAAAPAVVSTWDEARALTHRVPNAYAKKFEGEKARMKLLRAATPSDGEATKEAPAEEGRSEDIYVDGAFRGERSTQFCAQVAPLLQERHGA
jgi:hypothetical protein